jgi:hypothetical protein
LNTIKREIRAGRLRASKRAGRLYVLGEWLIEFFRGGDLLRASTGLHGAQSLGAAD